MSRLVKAKQRPHCGRVAASLAPGGKGANAFGGLDSRRAVRARAKARRRATPPSGARGRAARCSLWQAPWARSEEHTSELQSLMRISYAVFCLKKKTNKS